MRGFKGSSENHSDDQMITSVMFVEPLTPRTLEPFGDKKRINVFA